MTYRTSNHVLAAIRDILLIIVMMLALAVGYRITTALGDMGERLEQLPTAGMVADQPLVGDVADQPLVGVTE